MRDRDRLDALGCVAYWLPAGTVPFDEEEPGALLRRHAQSPPPPLSARSPQPIPDRLEALVMACLAKEPGDRPRNADRLRADLAASVDGAQWTPEDAEAWWATREDGAIAG